MPGALEIPVTSEKHKPLNNSRARFYPCRPGACQCCWFSGNPGGMYRHPFLSDAQREAIESAHFDLDEREIARYWSYRIKTCSVLIADAANAQQEEKNGVGVTLPPSV